MADPKIVYDIVANAEGGGEVDRLATSLQKLDQAIDPAAAARAAELAAELQRLGAQQAAVARFQELGAATEKAAADLTAADAAVAALRAQIDASGAPTTAQAGRLEKLGAAALTARNDLAAQTAALDASRGKLAALGIDANAAAEAEAALGTATKAIRTELTALGTSLQGVNARALVDDLKQLGAQQQGIQQLRDLGTATDKARIALTAAEAALQAYNEKLSSTEAPTAAQVNQQQRLGFAVDDARTKFAAQSAALEAAGGKLSALGVETGNLAAAEERLRTAAQATLEQIQQLGAQQAAVARFQELAAATAKASTALEQSVSAVSEFRASMSSTTAPTATEAAELDRLVSAAHAAQVAIQDQATAQNHAAEVARAAGVSLESLAAAQARGRDQAAATATAAGQVANAYQRVGASAITSGEQQSAAAAKTVTVLESLRGQLSLLQQVAGLALGGSIVGGLAKEIGQTADEYANLSARIKIATGDGAAFAQSLQGVFAVAQRTGTAVDDVAKLFTKLEQAGQKLGLTNADALRLTETITQATQLSGEAAESANAAIVQFSQGLAAGVLRGQDLNSVLEQAPRLAQALAAGLGVTTGELKKLGEAGSLTSQQVIGALQGQSAAVQREFDQLPPTIGRAITSLSNNWTAYVGEVDKATGASATAARAIVALGNNLETIGALLFSAGKAAAAYAAVNLARTFLANAAAAAASAEAKAVETAATQANTAATIANSAAKTANATATVAAGEAGVAAAANAGKFAAALSGLKVLGLVTVLTNFREIGTAIGEGAAKLFGYDKPIKALEEATKADEQAARANAAAKAELAQRLQLAADKAIGLNDQSRKLIGTFDQEVAKGEEVSVALDKVGKALEFQDLSGIKNGITALDALAQSGKITGAQLRDSLSGAISGADLTIFATNAKAAFDSSEQGARRLKEALDAIATQALARAGTSLEELTTGFSTGATKAINDVDALGETLKKLGITGNDAARVLSGALDKATEAAGTERAVQAVMDRFTELGKQGQLTGQQVSDGLAKAQEKIDALTPGIQGLAEAARKFGTDVPELMTGVSKAFQDSVTEVTAFGDELTKAGVSAQRASPLLAAALDQRIAAAKTKEEIALLRAETDNLAASGKLMGVAYQDALDKMKAKAAELSPALIQARADAERRHAEGQRQRRRHGGRGRRDHGVRAPQEQRQGVCTGAAGRLRHGG